MDDTRREILRASACHAAAVGVCVVARCIAQCLIKATMHSVNVSGQPARTRPRQIERAPVSLPLAPKFALTALDISHLPQTKPRHPRGFVVSLALAVSSQRSDGIAFLLSAGLCTHLVRAVARSVFPSMAARALERCRRARVEFFKSVCPDAILATLLPWCFVPLSVAELVLDPSGFAGSTCNARCVRRCWPQLHRFHIP